MVPAMAWTKTIISPSNSLGYWGTQSMEFGTTIVDSGAAVTGCNRAQLVFTRTVPAGIRDDVMVCNLHIGKIAGSLTSYFNLSGDIAAALAPLTTWFNSSKIYINDQVTFREVRWYAVRDDQARTGPPVAVSSVGVAGTATTSRAPDQLALSHTLITAARRHWGRIYLPGVTRSVWDTTTGRGVASVIDPLSGFLRTAINSLDTAGFRLGVWSPTARSFLDTWKLQVDDVPDVQRRRRPKQANYRKIYTS